MSEPTLESMPKSFAVQPPKPRRREYERIKSIFVDEPEQEYWSDSSCETESLRSLTTGASMSCSSSTTGASAEIDLESGCIEMAAHYQEDCSAGYMSDSSCTTEGTFGAYPDIDLESGLYRVEPSPFHVDGNPEGSEQCNIEINLSANDAMRGLDDPRDILIRQLMNLVQKVKTTGDRHGCPMLAHPKPEYAHLFSSQDDVDAFRMGFIRPETLAEFDEFDLESGVVTASKQTGPVKRLIALLCQKLATSYPFWRR